MEQKNRTDDRMQYPRQIHVDQLITRNDLLLFKKELIDELLSALKAPGGNEAKKWMKSHEVRKLLKISPGTLQTLKSSGIIPYTKVGGVHFYDFDDIQGVLQSGKSNNKKLITNSNGEEVRNIS